MCLFQYRIDTLFKTCVVTRLMKRLEYLKLRRCVTDDGESEMSVIALTFGGVSYVLTANEPLLAWLLSKGLAAYACCRISS